MINSFTDSNRFLSNFWTCAIVFEGMSYKSVEHAYQASKTLDPVKRQVMQRLATATQAKRYGKQLELRHDWNDVRLGIMGYLVYQKFSTNHQLKHMLLATGDQQLVEGNHWGDTFWGVCKGKGANHLGKILMKVRDEIRAKETL